MNIFLIQFDIIIYKLNSENFRIQIALST